MDKDIEKAREDMKSLICKLVQEQFDKAAMSWSRRNPKRKIRLVSGMGSCFFVIDGEILQISFDFGCYSCDWEGWKRHGVTYDKQKQVFKELYNVTIWLHDNLERYEFESDYLTDKVYN